MDAKKQSAYAQAGVDIAEGQRATELMKTAVQATFTPHVLSDIGSFGGLFSVNHFKEMSHPVLVASTDGVGTKTKVAAHLQRWDTIGYDIVNHCANDILVQGAKPLFFLDYVASAKLNAEQIAAIVTGIARACEEIGCAVLGGETAEMPGVYESGEIDLVGTIVGVVDKPRLIDGKRIQEGDVIIGLPSNGLHTNGFTLARRVLADFDWRECIPGWGMTLGEALLVPHRAYVQEVAQLWEAGVDIRGLSHITGGGLIDNPPRIFPEGLGARLERGTWPELPVFDLIQTQADIPAEEMFHVFNMGLGMLVIVPAEQAELAEETIADACIVGKMVAGSGVEIV